MAKFADKSVEIPLGCGLIATLFQRGNSKPIKQPLPPLSTKKSSNPSQKPSEKQTFTKPSSITPKNSFSNDQKHVGKSSTDGTRQVTSCDLSATVISHRKSTQNRTLDRGASGNIMLLGHLENLKQQQRNQTGSSDQKTVQQKSRVLMGNIVRQPSIRSHSMLNKLDPDVLKSMGNEHYKHGKYEEAIALYNQAIAINPRNPCYYSNKSAALMSLNRLIEAAIECRQAIRLDPLYHNAQYRLARLYFRLGEAEKAIDHYRQSGPKADKKDIAKAQHLKRLIYKCTEAHMLRDYNTLLKESQKAMNFGADSAPQIFAMRAEVLTKLHRHEEAYTTIQKGPNFEIALHISLFGSAKTAYLLITRAQVYLTVGRFEDGIVAAQEAAKLYHNNNEIITILRRIKGLVWIRLKGNELFNESKYNEACCMYTEGLEQEPYNSVLLFNRAVSRFKLGQFEKAVEDCTAALVLRPSYTKARFRRADCYIKLERWEAAIQDFEALLQEKTMDEEVKRAVLHAKIQLERERDEDQKQKESNLVLVASN